MRLPAHVEHSAIVLDDVRLLYVPVPKAGSTAVLWALLDLVDLDEDAFTRSTKLETTRALTIHDLSIWGRAYRLEGRSNDASRIFDSPDWLAFTTVRDPVPRLWSAWVSKVLVRDPRFVRAYGEEAWFPASITTAQEVVASFRSFVAVLSERPAEWHDPHWSSQADLAGIGRLPYDLVARVERLPGELAAVASHLRARGREGLRLRRENPSLVPFVPEILDADAWDRCAAFTERDREVLGYAMPERGAGVPADAWLREVDLRLPGIQAVIQRNERIGDLKRLLASTRAS